MVYQLPFTEKTQGNFTVKQVGDYYELHDNTYVPSLYCSSAESEWKAYEKVISQATGNVLLSGLGLGNVVRAILLKPEVVSITVFEKEQDVIDIISNTLDLGKVMIVCQDIYDYNLSEGQYWDCVWHDIWHTGQEALDQGPTLMTKFKDNCGWQSFQMNDL